MSNQAAKVVKVGDLSVGMFTPVSRWKTPIVGSTVDVFGLGISPGSSPPPGETSDVDAIGVDKTDVEVVLDFVTTGVLSGVATAIFAEGVLEVVVGVVEAVVVERPNIEFRSTLYFG